MSVGALPQHSMSWFAGHSSANAPMNSTVWSSRSSSSAAVARALSLRPSPGASVEDLPDFLLFSASAPLATALSHSLAHSAKMKDSRWWVSTRRSGDDSASCATSGPNLAVALSSRSTELATPTKLGGRALAAAAGSWSTGILNVASV